VNTVHLGYKIQPVYAKTQIHCVGGQNVACLNVKPVGTYRNGGGGGCWGEETAWGRETAPPIVRQLVGKSPAFQIYTATEAGNHATHKFITVFTTVHLLPLSWARWNQSTPSHSVSCRSTLLILPSMSWPWKCFLSFRFPFVIHTSYMPIFRQGICIN